jgi:hypothetical protein
VANLIQPAVGEFMRVYFCSTPRSPFREEGQAGFFHSEILMKMKLFGRCTAYFAWANIYTLIISTLFVKEDGFLALAGKLIW